MSTLRDEISAVRATHKLLSGDASINNRTIASELKRVAIARIKQYTNRRLLWGTDTIFTTIPCLELEEVPIGECCDFTSTKTVARTKEKLPSISEGTFQYLIQGVYDISISKSLKYMSLNRYINSLKLGLEGNDVYFWLHDGYLYVSSPYVRTVMIKAYFEGDLPDSILYPECECKGRPKKDPCINPLDQPFKCPGFLIDDVVNSVSQKLLETYHKISIDHTSDGKDDQVNKN